MPTTETIILFTLSAIASTLIPITTLFINEKPPYPLTAVIAAIIILNIPIILMASIFMDLFYFTKYIDPPIIIFHLYAAGFTAVLCPTLKNLTGTLLATLQAIIMLIIILTLN